MYWPSPEDTVEVDPQPVTEYRPFRHYRSGPTVMEMILQFDSNSEHNGVDGLFTVKLANQDAPRSFLRTNQRARLTLTSEGSNTGRRESQRMQRHDEIIR